MINFYKYDTDSNFVLVNNYEKGCIIVLEEPTEQELKIIAAAADMPIAYVDTILYKNERSRIDIRENYIFCVINTPTKISDTVVNSTAIGILITKDTFIIISPKMVNCTKYLQSMQTFDTKIDNLLSLKYEIARSFVESIKSIIDKFQLLEQDLIATTNNEDVIKIMDLQKSLTFLTTSIYSNDLVIARILKLKDKEVKNNFADFAIIDEELIDDVYTENKQAIEMVDTYSKIISNMMETINSMITNNQNKFLKLLANLTILLMIPTIIASFWGMNVTVPLQEDPRAFVIIIISSVAISLLILIIMLKKKLLN